MKKSIPDLKHDIAAANRQISMAKKSGNKRQLNLGRQRRLEAWRELRDEHGMKPPKHVASALKERYGKPAKKEETEFKKPAKEEPNKEYDMVFTLAEVERLEKAAKRKLPVPQKTPEAVSQMGSPKLAREVRAWLNTFPEYKELRVGLQRMEKQEEAASRELLKHGRDPKMPKREIREMAEDLRVKRWKLFEAEGKLDLFLKNKEKVFRDQHSFDPELIGEYRLERQAFGNQRGRKMARIFTPEEQEVINRAARKARGKNRMEEGMKEIILERAKALYERLETPSEDEEKSLQEIKKAAINPNIDTDEMIKVAVGEENIEPEETELLVVAVAGELLERLETRVAMLERERAPTAIARAERRKKKKPVKLARLERKRKEEKEV